MMSKQEDVVQIGTSLSGKETLRFLIDELKWFDLQNTALKFAITVAIKYQLPVETRNTLTTSHNVSSLDSDQSLAKIMMDLFPGLPPYRTAQVLADVGLEFIQEKIRNENWRISDFVS
jgi:hypothetical protein